MCLKATNFSVWVCSDQQFGFGLAEKQKQLHEHAIQGSY